MTFSDVMDEYNKQYKRANDEYIAHYAAKPKEKYAGFFIDSAVIDAMLIQAARDEFGFTESQAQFIHGRAYTDFHSSYGDMPFGMKDYCQMVSDFNKITA